MCHSRLHLVDPLLDNCPWLKTAGLGFIVINCGLVALKHVNKVVKGHKG